MASAASQRTGLITATVVATIVALTALIFAFIFSARATKAEAEKDETIKAYSTIVARNAVSGPLSIDLKAARESGGPNLNASMPLLNVAVEQRDQLTKLVGGASPSVASSSGVAALVQASEAMKGAGLGEVNTTDNMAGAIAQLAGAVTSLTQQKVAALAEMATAKDEAAKTVASAQAAIAANVADFAKERAAIATEREGLTTDRGGMVGAQTAAGQAFEAQIKILSDELAKTSQINSDLIRDKKQAEKDRDLAQAKAAMTRPDSVQSLVRRADGAITRISTDRTVYIDLGAGQQVVPGMTFEVYSKIDGVPALAKDETTMPMGKASIEVVRVTPNGSEARIIKSKPGQTVTEGDIVANLVYDRNTKYNFVVYGKFDLSKKGAPAAEDAAVLKRLVGEFGGQVKDKVSVDTDFLVIGSEPVIPDFSEEQRRDPVNAKILADAQEELDKYNAVVNQAKSLFVPVLNQNRFLYYVGYFDKARR